MTPSDEDLLKAWTTGDPLAGATLVRRHFDRVDLFFRVKVGEERCVDLTQITFLAVQEAVRLGRFRGDSSFRTWLFGIARNKLLVHLRDGGLEQKRFDPDADSVADSDPSPVTIIDEKQHRRLLLAALRRLALDDQVMLELHYWEHMQIAEIAAVVDKPINTVKARMRRARLRLEELMDELADSQDELETTRSGLEGWAERVREECGDENPAPVDG
jgi:RNA polymerase sigma factor (sigma-70 family)